LNFRLRNVLLLTLTQATSSTSVTLISAVGSLAGYALATNKALATLPSTMSVIGTALSTIPASILMKRVGRRGGFVMGALCATAGGLISVAAMARGHFWLLTAAALLLGVSVAFAQQYRFAAAETSIPEFRSRAISFVLAGGLAAAFIGPMLARATVQLYQTMYLGAYLCVSLLGLLTAALLAGLRMPPPAEEAVRAGGRPITEIVLQPIFIVAVLAQMMGQGVMNLLMTGTPLAMMAHHHSFADTAFVIQWHVVGMFLPGFFTGSLVQRWGERTVIVVGIAINLLAVVAAALDVGVHNFWLAMTLNGIGWNFMFVAGSALVTKAYAPGRARAHAGRQRLPRVRDGGRDLAVVRAAPPPPWLAGRAGDGDGHAARGARGVVLAGSARGEPDRALGSHRGGLKPREAALTVSCLGPPDRVRGAGPRYHLVPRRAQFADAIGSPAEGSDNEQSEVAQHAVDALVPGLHWFLLVLMSNDPGQCRDDATQLVARKHGVARYRRVRRRSAVWAVSAVLPSGELEAVAPDERPEVVALGNGVLPRLVLRPAVRLGVAQRST
jgi:MFS family permease